MGSNRLSGAVAVAVLASLLSTTAAAQWLNYPTPGTPRLPDGKPNLSAPAPRTADGKPDLSGVWRGAGPLYRFNIAQDLEARGHSAVGRGAVPAARAGFPEGQSPRAMPAGQRPVPQFLQPDQDRPDPGADRDAVRVSQQPASNRVHRWPRSSQGSQSHLAGLLGRAMGGRHAGGDDRGVQRQGLARQRRTSTNRIASHHGTPPASRLRPHGFRNDHRRSESVHQAVHHQDGAAAGAGYRPPGGRLRERARSRPACPATPGSD